jgi:hypothetical protein
MQIGLAVGDVLGVEGSWVSAASLRIPTDRVLTHDLNAPLKLENVFDLALSLEVAEHLSPSSADTLVASLVAAAPAVVFSAAIPRQGGTGHINEQWPEYWASKFKAHAYVPVDAIRPRIWLNANIAWYYRQNMMIFVKEDKLASYPRLAGSFREDQPVLPLVHPDRYLRVAKFSLVPAKDALAERILQRLPWARRLRR